MPVIVFRGKTYNSVFEMPDEVRKAYQLEKKRPTTENMSTPGMFDMPAEVREIYEKALDNLNEKPIASQTSNRAERSKNVRPSDESLYRPSPPIITDSQPAIEPESNTRRLVTSLVLAFLLLGIAYLVLQFML